MLRSFFLLLITAAVLYHVATSHGQGKANPKAPVARTFADAGKNERLILGPLDVSVIKVEQTKDPTPRVRIVLFIVHNVAGKIIPGSSDEVRLFTSKEFCVYDRTPNVYKHSRNVFFRELDPGKPGKLDIITDRLPLDDMPELFVEFGSARPGKSLLRFRIPSTMWHKEGK